MATARRTRRDSQARTRAELIAAAREVFLARSFHAATLEEIAERAGYTKGAVYSNFVGKDDLFLALLAEHYARRAELYATAVLEADDIEDAYRAVARVMLDAFEREPRWWPLISDFASHATRHPELRERLRAARGTFLDVLAASIEGVCRQHDMTFSVPPREVARGVGALMRGMTLEWAIDPSPTDAAAFEQMLVAYLRGLAVPLHERSTA
jgi:AcrR family transcriptional regulator